VGQHPLAQPGCRFRARMAPVLVPLRPGPGHRHQPSQTEGHKPGPGAGNRRDAACCDLARILRLPGFVNHKPPAKPVQIVARHPVRYTLAEMEPFAVGASTEEAAAEIGDIPEMTEELKRRFAEARKSDKSGEMRRAWRGEIGDGSSDSRYVLVKALLATGRFAPEETVAIICSRQWFNRRSRQIKAPEAVAEDAIRLIGKQFRVPE